MAEKRRYARWKKLSPGMYGCRLWRPRLSRRLYVIARCFQKTLRFFWLPIFIMGVYYFLNYGWEVEIDRVVFGSFIGALVGTFLHELAHALVCISYKGHVDEIGIMVYLLLPGAYVQMEIDSIKSDIKRARIYAAGVELNFMVAGISFFLAAIFHEFGGIWFGFSNSNLCMALLNLLLLDGLDGAAIFGALVGNEAFIEDCRMLWKRPENREYLYRRGLLGTSVLVISCVMTIFQILLPVLIGTNFLGMILGVIK